jgi:arylsulfatase A-like enzyme
MKSPNILFLFPDQWRGDWVHGNDSLPLHTPNLDLLMKKGMTFQRCYTSSPVCAPARACLASGLDYTKCPAPSNKYDYDLSVPTFYQGLRDVGYHVSGVGKFDLHKGSLDWGLDGSKLLDEWGFTDGIDNEGKFDGSRSYRNAGEPKGPYLHFLQQQGVADRYVQEHADTGKHRDAYVTALSDEQYCDNWLSENGLRILRALPEDQPWFMQVNFTGPHNPMDVTQRMHDAWKSVEFPPPHHNTQERYTDEDHQRNRQYYAAMIENIDRQIGRFLDVVRERGEEDQTFVVFCSDHGEMLGDHNCWGKSTWQEPSIRVPLVVAGPGVKPDAKTQALVSLHDLTATFLELAGVGTLPDLDGKSLVPLLRGKSEQHRDKVFRGLHNWRCWVTSRYKYISGFKDKSDILIDLQQDPWEDQNIAYDNQQLIKDILA